MIKLKKNSNVTNLAIIRTIKINNQIGFNKKMKIPVDIKIFI